MPINSSLQHTKRRGGNFEKTQKKNLNLNQANQTATLPGLNFSKQSRRPPGSLAFALPEPESQGPPHAISDLPLLPLQLLILQKPVSNKRADQAFSPSTYLSSGSFCPHKTAPHLLSLSPIFTHQPAIDQQQPRISSPFHRSSLLAAPSALRSS